jgi:hypothetical protein
MTKLVMWKRIQFNYVFKKTYFDWLIDWLIIYGFASRIKNISLIWRHHHCRWRATKFWPMLGAHGLWAGRDLYRATPAATRDLGFSGLIRRTAPFSHLLRHTRGCGGSILTRILTGSYFEHLRQMIVDTFLNFGSFFMKICLLFACILSCFHKKKKDWGHFTRFNSKLGNLIITGCCKKIVCQYVVVPKMR